MPRAAPTKNMPMLQRTKRRGGATGGGVGGKCSTQGDYGYKDGAESIILSACGAESTILSLRCYLTIAATKKNNR